jgi:hypothetical protein
VEVYKDLVRRRLDSEVDMHFGLVCMGDHKVKSREVLHRSKDHADGRLYSAHLHRLEVEDIATGVGREGVDSRHSDPDTPCLKDRSPR